MSRWIAAALLLLAGVWACSAPARTVSATGPEPRPEPSSSEQGRIERMEDYFPNTALVTQDGRRLRFYDDLVRGKCLLIQFMYTSCDGT